MVRAASASAVLRSILTERRARKAAGAGARLLAALLVAVVATAGPVSPAAARARAAQSSIGTIRTAQLPDEGRQVLAAIRAGGPFAFKRDGIAFGNREGLLPMQRRGYYAEYTVPTPGADTRGARRIIAGRGDTGDYRTSDEYYYTNDHYQSFRRIVQ
jgi:ribonuclease T1